MTRFHPCLMLSLLLITSSCAQTSAGVAPEAPRAGAPSAEPEIERAAAPASAGKSVAAGRFHLVGHVDAISLELDPDGTYRMASQGCDYGNMTCGRWQRSGAEIVLTPSAGAPSVGWPEVAPIRSLVARRDGDALVIAGNDVLGTSFSQRWDAGGVCAICGGREGPTGQRTCNDPLPTAESCAPPNDK